MTARRRRCAWLGLVAAALLLSGPGIARATSHPKPANRLITVRIPAKHGTLPAKWVGYAGAPRADILLPKDYDPHKAYPLVVILNGLNDNYAWYARWGFTPMMADLGAIVVMPEGANGWYTDWSNAGRRGDPSWETYELDDVLPYVEHHYRIKPQRRYHAIVGISMGGMGSTYLGGRLPGFFGSVATLSGFVDPEYHANIADPAMGILSGAPSPDAVEGPPSGFYLRGHDPTALVDNLRHTRLFEATGTGVPSQAGLSQLSPSGFAAIVGGSAEEGPIILPMNQRYHAALLAAGIHVTYRQRPGGHDIPDFVNEFKAMLAWGLFKPVTAHPHSWVNRTVATHGQLWDVRYRFTRPPTHVVRFRQVGRRLSISTAGSPVILHTHGCVIRTRTPATVRLTVRRGSRRAGCRS